MQIEQSRKAVIITLPHGGLAVVHHDGIANTATVQCHGYHAILTASDSDVLEQAAQLAAPDERPIETLIRVYGDYVVQPRDIDRTRVGESVVDAYATEEWKDGADEHSPIMLRDYARELWEANKGDASWAEYWDSVMRTVIARAMA